MTVAGAPEGADAALLADLAVSGQPVLHVALDDARVDRLLDLLRFYNPDISVAAFPAWDCLPYDRVSPNGEIASERASVLAGLASGDLPPIVLTTVSAILQRIPGRDVFESRLFTLERGGRLDQDALTSFLAQNGYARVGTVREPGEFAIRGGIIDLYPPGLGNPLRLDLFGDVIEDLRAFDAATQRSDEALASARLSPVRELVLNEDAIERFRTGYRGLVDGGGLTDDPLYEAVSAGQAFPGMEHWLPLFHDSMATLPAWLPDSLITLDPQADQAIRARLDQIVDYFTARADHAGSAKMADMSGGGRYWPLAPEQLYLGDTEWDSLLAGRPSLALSSFAAEDGAGTVDLGGRQGVGFADARQDPNRELFDEVAARIQGHKSDGDKVLVTATSAGAADRLGQLLDEQDIPTSLLDNRKAIDHLASDVAGIAVLPLEHGILMPGLALVTEQDIFGEKLVRRARKRARGADEFLTELSAISEGDYVVHMDHGIGQYDGLETLEVTGAPHDCLMVHYHGGDKLYVPVENMDVLARYGAEDSGAQLDRLGGAGWQARKARVKARIKEIADKLLAVAAERELSDGEVIHTETGHYEEFAARFPYDETEDQLSAIGDVLADLESGRPMDRLVCGDVGFGKTEVAIRAAYNAVMAGHQTAVVVPTTLLARQHYETFRQRFAGQPVRIGRLSRLVTQKEASLTRKALETGEMDIVIGTHALLGKTVRFKNLGLLVVDEEQHFGVGQKERLKELRANVHILTLTATPIPRTLQMALAGVRDMSLIATPPVDRLAVRTFVLPFDPVVLREAMQREIFRGGQIFYVCPRIKDLVTVEETIRELMPDARIAMAHGQMAPADLEEVMTRFYDGEYQVLISTNIIESGLDIPSVNTIIIHRADMFGLSQLYQLRGRVGRSKTRAYAYLTVPSDKMLTKTAQKRLEVMQTLDTLGAGFSLASHDMDIRGAGNLLGEEQSGHVREVGIELYQHMLEEAVATARDKSGTGAADDADDSSADWTPQITIGMPVMIPEAYVADLTARLGLYRRSASLVDREEIDGFAAELADRFGPLPEEVQNLLDLIGIKQLCRLTNVAKVDAGPKGAVLTFHNNYFSDPAGLVTLIAQESGTMKLRPDQKLVYRRNWTNPEARVKGIKYLMRKLSDLVVHGQVAP